MRTPLPLEMTFPCTQTGQFNDWLSFSGNKVTDVKLLDDGKYIFFETGLIPEEPIDTIIKLNINLGGLSISSPAYEALQFPLMNTVDFVSADAPNSTGWTLAQFQAFEVECADTTFLKVQSYKTKVPDLLPSWQIIGAGVRATLQHSPVRGNIQRRVLKLEKLLKYVLA